MQDNMEESNPRVSQAQTIIKNATISLTTLYNQEKILNKQIATLRNARAELHKTISMQENICLLEKLRLRWGERGKIAIKKYAQFHNKDTKNITLRNLQYSSCGIEGWYKCNLNNYYFSGTCPQISHRKGIKIDYNARG